MKRTKKLNQTLVTKAKTLREYLVVLTQMRTLNTQLKELELPECIKDFYAWPTPNPRMSRRDTISTQLNTEITFVLKEYHNNVATHPDYDLTQIKYSLYPTVK